MGMATAIDELHGLEDSQIVEQVLAGEIAAYEILMRRHNQRLYRAARAILKNDDEAEDVLQETYTRAYQHLRQFSGHAQFSTWLTRIAVHESLARLRQWKRTAETPATDDPWRWTMDSFESSAPLPDEQVLSAETRAVLESAIDSLPDSYRLVFVLREVEGMSTAETAAALELTEETVKVRLHRGRHMLRRELYERVGEAGPEAFRFMGERCDRVVRIVLGLLSPDSRSRSIDHNTATLSTRSEVRR